MILNVTNIIPTESQFGIVLEYRVTNPSKNPDENVNGKVLIKILTPSLTPVLNDVMLE